MRKTISRMVELVMIGLLIAAPVISMLIIATLSFER